MATTPIRPYDPAFETRVVVEAQAGRSRAEIAVALGASLADFDAWAADHPAFAVALADADTAARAWWEAQPRLAFEKSKPFKAATWSKAMAQRYGRSSDRPRPQAKPATKAEPDVEYIYDIPDPGRLRRGRKGADR
jgi:hypothetical protein